MKLATTDPSNNELIATQKILFKFDNQFPDLGWPLPVLFDRTTNTYRVLNFPGLGLSVEFDQMPSDGDYEFESPEPIQWARDEFYTTICYRMY